MQLYTNIFPIKHSLINLIDCSIREYLANFIYNSDGIQYSDSETQFSDSDIQYSNNDTQYKNSDTW